MADDIVTITLSPGSFVDGSDEQADYSGTVTVDYTAGTVSGDFKVEGTNGNGFGDSGHFERLLVQNGDQYQASGEGFTVFYTGQTPSTARVQLVANGNDTYDTNNNPAGDQNAAVSSSQQSGQATCFLPGTLIRTARGEVAVEALRVGDLAVTASGQLRPVVWTGHRTLDGQGRTLPHDQQPIRIRAGAFGPGVPARDLWLSPGHPVLVGADADGAGGVLVPVMCLVNGTTVARQSVQAVTYWHVELDGHDILLAEGLPAESYLDYGNRAWFTEGEEHALLNPDHVAPGLGARCRPVATDGPLVKAERRRLDQVFATALAAQCAWPGAEDVFALA